MYPHEMESTDVAAIRRAKLRAIRHIDFVIDLYHGQLAGGRYFLHEITPSMRHRGS